MEDKYEIQRERDVIYSGHTDIESRIDREEQNPSAFSIGSVGGNSLVVDSRLDLEKKLNLKKIKTEIKNSWK